MEIEITQVTPWSRALNAARWTANKEEIDKEPSYHFMRDMMISGHSPKRLVEFDIKIRHIPYCNAVHFVRHFLGVEKFQCTLRDDRNNLIDDRKKLPQDYPVNLWLACNAQAIQNISMVRLCRKASKETREIWEGVKKKMMDVDLVVSSHMIPQCVFRGFCPERDCCGYVRSNEFDHDLRTYRANFTQPKIYDNDTTF